MPARCGSPKNFGLPAVRIFAVGLLIVAFSPNAQPQTVEAARPQSSLRIALSAVGYEGLSESARLSGESNLTLDFVDASHLLFTFNPKKLFKRLPDCPPSHDDRLIHAAIIELPSGRIVREADWYLHDSRPYLWRLGSGQFLLRRLNRLYRVDGQLSEKPVFDSPKELRWVSVTPDGKQVITETLEKTGLSRTDAGNKPHAQITFLDANSFAALRSIELRDEVHLEAASTGFAEVMRAGSNLWLVRFGPEHVNIARVKSIYSPKILYSTPNTMLLGRCSLKRDQYSISAFTLTGHRLWGQHLPGCRYRSGVSAAEDGIRFALSSIAIRNTEPKSPLQEQAGSSDELLQTLQVFDTASGSPMLSLELAAPSLDERNFSLAPDASLLAIVTETSIDLYSLPEISNEDRARYLVVKADLPSLSPSKAKPAEGKTEPLYLSSDMEKDASAEAPAPAESSSTKDASRVSPASAASSSADLATPDIPTFKAETRLVALDVVVTDSQGQPVKGLQPSDFVVAENGKLQTLRGVREYAGQQPTAAVPRPAPPKRPPNVFSNDSVPSDLQAGAVTVVLLDLLNTPMPDQAFAQAQLIKFLRSKPADAQFALCTLGSRLQMIQGFTHDGKVLVAVARGKKGSMRYRPLIDPDSVLQPSVEAGTATARLLPQLDFFVASLKQEQAEARLLDADRRMFATVDAFAHLARYLSGIPGRKNLVWLSGSFQLGIYPDSKGDSPFLEAHSYSEQLKKVANLLQEAHVAVYPVDVRGLQTNPLFTATTNDTLSPLSMQSSTPIGVAQEGSAPFAGPRPLNNAVAISVMQDQNEQFALAQTGERATMDQIAADTGGRAFYNANDISKAIYTAAEQGSNYYALSYTPSNKNYDGRFRRIKVSLPGKKFHLAYRSGYYALNPSLPAKGSRDLRSSLAVAAMQQGSPQSRQILFSGTVVPIGKPFVTSNVADVAAGKGKRKKDTPRQAMQHYSIDYTIAADDLHFGSTPNGTFLNTLNFMITVFDEDGRLVAAQNSQAAVNLKSEALRAVLKDGLRARQQIDVPTKSASMRLGVEEISDSHIGTLEIPLPVKAPPQSASDSRRHLPPIEPD